MVVSEDEAAVGYIFICTFSQLCHRSFLRPPLFYSSFLFVSGGVDKFLEYSIGRTFLIISYYELSVVLAIPSLFVSHLNFFVTCAADLVWHFSK